MSGLEMQLSDRPACTLGPSPTPHTPTSPNGHTYNLSTWEGGRDGQEEQRLRADLC